MADQLFDIPKSYNKRLRQRVRRLAKNKLATHPAIKFGEVQGGNITCICLYCSAWLTTTAQGKHKLFGTALKDCKGE